MVDADYAGLALEYREALIRGDSWWDPRTPRSGDDPGAMNRWLDGTVGRIVALASAPFEYVETTVTAGDRERDRDARVIAYTSRVVIVVSTKLHVAEGRSDASWRIDVLARNSLRALSTAESAELGSTSEPAPHWSPITAVYERDTVRLTDTDSPRFGRFYPSLLADLIH
jgi:hypothetical protein